MVIDCKSHEFRKPQRAVLEPPDVKKWEQSEAYQDILGFLISMNDGVKGKKLSVECSCSKVTNGLLKLLDTLSQWIDDIPPVDQPQRYGNKAFRDFYEKLKEKAEDIIREALPEEYHSAVPEISVYLVESVGNSTRIDYGTGHELAFIMFLTCIFKIGALTQAESVSTVMKIFKRYLDLSRKLQMIYKMEPAGSQGVWSLDDYQFIPFIWGSSQLHMHPKIAPEMFTNEKIVNENADEYMFLSCIKFVLSVKTGPFAEHSNQLWNISGVQSWSKINSGLIKMYKAEVLHKFPVVQHVLFGSILSINEAAEIKFAPPGGGMPMSRMPPTMVPPGMRPPSERPGPGSRPLPDGLPLRGKLPQTCMPSSIPGAGARPMPDGLSLTCSLPPMVRLPNSDHSKPQNEVLPLLKNPEVSPCVEDRHPAMSPLDICTFRPGVNGEPGTSINK